MLNYNPIICAIDTTNVVAAKMLADVVRPYVGAVKLGLEFFVANGVAGVTEVVGEEPLFLDLKFHDIPNTVAGAVRATSGINSFLTTIHTQGGKAMMQAAKKAALGLPNQPMVVGVTILTSMDNADLESIGFKNAMQEQVVRLAALAQESGLDGVVCSPHEIEAIRKRCGKDFKLVVPGIRPVGSVAGDQKRVMTPKEAMECGANYLVIGRPITEAANPASVAAEILASL